MNALQRRRLEKLDRNRHKRTRQGLTYEEWCQKGRHVYLSVHQNRTNAWFQQKEKRTSSAMTLQQQNNRPSKRARTHQQQEQQRRRRPQDEKTSTTTTTTTTTAPTNAAALATARNENENDDYNNTARRSLGDDFDNVFDSRNQPRHQASMPRTSPKKRSAAKREELLSSSDEIEVCAEEDDDLIILHDDDDDAQKEQETSIDANEHQQTTEMPKDDSAATTLPSADTSKGLQEDLFTKAVTQEDSSSIQAPQAQRKGLSLQEGPLQHFRQQQSSSPVDATTANKSFFDTIFPSKKRHRTTFSRSNRLQHQDSNNMSHSSDKNTCSSAQGEDASSFLTFDVASSTNSSTPQFWALVEGLVVYDTSTTAASYWQDLWMDRRGDLLPTTGRVLELLPVECKSGRWQAGVVRLVHPAMTSASAGSGCSSSISNNSKIKTKAVPCSLGLLRESEQDWRNKRVVLRHASLPHTTFKYLTTKAVPEGYTVSVIDPSLHRSAGLQKQGLLSGVAKNKKNDTPWMLWKQDRNPTAWTVASLSLVAFEGFSSVAESDRHAPMLARTVLQACSKDSFWSKHNHHQQQQKRHSGAPPDLMTIPAFGGASPSNSMAPTIVQGSGGISLLGNIVDDVRGLDYQILILREEATNQIVGLDVVFCSKKSTNLSPSSTNTCLSVNTQSAALPLTTQNLELHNEKEPFNKLLSSSSTSSSASQGGKSSIAEKLLEHEPSSKRRKTSLKSQDPTLSSPSTDSKDEPVMSTGEEEDMDSRSGESMDSSSSTRIDPPKQPPLATAPITGSHNKESPIPMAATTSMSEHSQPMMPSSNNMSFDEKEELFKDVQTGEPVDSQASTRINPPKQPPLPTVPVTASNNKKTTCPATMATTDVPTTTSEQLQSVLSSNNAEKTEIRKPAKGPPRITPTPAATSTLAPQTTEPGGTVNKVPRRLFTENHASKHTENDESSSSDYHHAHEEEQETIADKELFEENTSDYYDAYEEEGTAPAVVDGEMFDAKAASISVCFHDMLYGGLKNDESEASDNELLSLSIPPRAYSKYAIVRLMQQCSDILYEEDGYSEVSQVSTWTWLYYWIFSGLLLAVFSPALLYLLRLLQGPHSLCSGTLPIVFDDESYFPEFVSFHLKSFFTGEDVSLAFLLFAPKAIGRDFRYPIEYANDTPLQARAS